MNNIRFVITYHDQKKLFMIDQQLSFNDLLKMIKNKFQILEKDRISLIHSLFNAEVDDISMIKEGDHYELFIEETNPKKQDQDRLESKEKFFNEPTFRNPSENPREHSMDNTDIIELIQNKEFQDRNHLIKNIQEIVNESGFGVYAKEGEKTTALFIFCSLQTSQENIFLTSMTMTIIITILWKKQKRTKSTHLQKNLSKKILINLKPHLF